MKCSESQRESRTRCGSVSPDISKETLFCGGDPSVVPTMATGSLLLKEFDYCENDVGRAAHHDCHDDYQRDPYKENIH